MTQNWRGPISGSLAYGYTNGLHLAALSLNRAQVTTFAYDDDSLHVAVNPGFPIAEADAGNNSQTLTVGGIAAPLGLWAQVAPGSPLVFLGWDAVADRRVAGYRVYRAQDGGAWQPVGGSFAPGYVDVAARALVSYRYAVAAYTAEGGESPLSLEVRVDERPLRVYLPFVERGVAHQ